MSGRFVDVHDNTGISTLAYVLERDVSSETPGRPSTAPAETLLVFPDHRGQTSLTWHNGSVASGIPVQLLFWGDYWNQSGAGLRGQLITQVQELLTGPFFEALDQYGAAKPVWGGARTVTEPYPPDGDFDGGDVGSMVWHLINGGVFPKPDEPGGNNAYYAMMPPGATLQGADGAHGYRHPASWMFWTDTVLVAWGLWHQDDADSMMMTFSHEIVELATDPRQGGWYNDDLDHKEGEIADLCQPNGWQSAFVGSVKVMPYWSARDQACVVPTFPLRVRIDGHISVDDVLDGGSGDKEYPFGQQRGLCGLLPACCFKGPYHWTNKKIKETASLEATTSGFHGPTVSWRITGRAVSGAGSLDVNVDVTRQTESGVTGADEKVTLSYEQAGSALSITNDSVAGSFDIPVSVQADEGNVSASGGTTVQGGTRIANCVVPFCGQVFTWGGKLEKDREACNKASDDLWKKTHKATEKKIGPLDPGELRPRDRAVLATAGAGVSEHTLRAAAIALARASALEITHPKPAGQLRHVLLTSLGLRTPQTTREETRAETKG